jgi:hypothetical protein
VDRRGIEPRDADLARISRYPIDAAQIGASFSLLAGLLAISLHTKPEVSLCLGPWLLADGVGFEPTEDFHPRWFSRPVP